MTPLLNTTMKGDEKMTAADRKKEQLELQKAEMDAANKALHADNERKEKERVEMQKSHEEKMKQFREQSEKEFKARMDALNRQMENERKEVRGGSTYKEFHRGEERNTFTTNIRS